MSLREELLADQDPRAGSCKVCRFLDTLSPAQRKEWEEAFADKAFTTSSLERAIAKRSPNMGKTVVARHRQRHVR